SLKSKRAIFTSRHTEVNQLFPSLGINL
ncbi:MAG: hypothetical protein FD144_4864, partial [Rhodospirillaceae bacterium]